MPATCLDLPPRSNKPRRVGITMVIDNGLPTRHFADAVMSAAPYVDIVKFGWGTSLVTQDLQRKIDCLHNNGIRFCFGGTLFEKFLIQDRFRDFMAFCHDWRCDMVEVSNGTIPLSNTDKAGYVRRCAEEFDVTSEVGFKDAARSDELRPAQWIESIHEDLEAGAGMVITEARESGRSGMCTADGRVRDGLIEHILASGIDPDRLLFEAPTKDLQAHFVTLLGPDVNLGNINPMDAIALETLRLGLRGDTLLHFEAALYA